MGHKSKTDLVLEHDGQVQPVVQRQLHVGHLDVPVASQNRSVQRTQTIGPLGSSTDDDDIAMQHIPQGVGEEACVALDVELVALRPPVHVPVDYLRFGLSKSVTPTNRQPIHHHQPSSAYLVVQPRKAAPLAAHARRLLDHALRDPAGAPGPEAVQDLAQVLVRVLALPFLHPPLDADGACGDGGEHPQGVIDVAADAAVLGRWMR